MIGVYCVALSANLRVSLSAAPVLSVPARTAGRQRQQSSGHLEIGRATSVLAGYRVSPVSDRCQRCWPALVRLRTRFGSTDTIANTPSGTYPNSSSKTVVHAHATSRLRRQRHVRSVSHDKGDSLKGTPHGQAKNPRSPAAGARLRELSRARTGACRRRGEGATSRSSTALTPARATRRV